MSLGINNYFNALSSVNNTQNKNVVDKTEKEKVEQAKSTDKTTTEDYFERLKQKFPNIRFNTTGSIAGSGKQVVVNISMKCLERMAKDPKFAKEVEFNLSGEGAGLNLINGMAKGDGVEVYTRTINYDANGNREASSGLQTANYSSTGMFSAPKLSGTNNDLRQRLEKKRKERKEEEYLQELREKRKEDKERLEKLAVERAKLNMDKISNYEKTKIEATSSGINKAL